MWTHAYVVFEHFPNHKYTWYMVTLETKMHGDSWFWGLWHGNDTPIWGLSNQITTEKKKTTTHIEPKNYSETVWHWDCTCCQLLKWNIHCLGLFIGTLIVFDFSLLLALTLEWASHCAAWMLNLESAWHASGGDRILITLMGALCCFQFSYHVFLKLDVLGSVQSVSSTKCPSPKSLGCNRPWPCTPKQSLA